MSDRVREVAEIPQQFVKEGTQVRFIFTRTRTSFTDELQFVNRCTKPNKEGEHPLSSTAGP